MFKPVGKRISYGQRAEELIIRTAEACDYAEKLENIFFHDLLDSSWNLRESLKVYNPVVKYPVELLKTGGIQCTQSMESSVLCDIQVLSCLKEYVAIIQHHDKTLRNNKHKEELNNFVNKLTGVKTILEELVSHSPNVETMSGGLGSLGFKPTRARTAHYNYKIISDSVRILTDMKKKLKEAVQSML